MTRRWVLASGNEGKLRELEALLEPRGIVLVPQSTLDVPAAPEEAATFVENALVKARNAARHTGLSAIADDSGLCVDALGGDPGVHSARYAGPAADDGANVRKLLRALAAVSEPQRRTARFHCVLVVLPAHDDPAPLIACGSWFGRITTAPAGTGGFGYDPVFLDPALGKTAAELAPAAKNRVSHRGRALERLLAALEQRDREA